MTKSFLTVLVLAASIFALQAFNATDRPVYQNLQILPQDISKEGLDSVMKHFSVSLGVKCGYCHARNEETRRVDWASDAKTEKHIARGMMKMSIDINKNYFAIHDESDQKVEHNPADSLNSRYMLKYVTCYTCHHGNPHPDSAPLDIEEEH